MVGRKIFLLSFLKMHAFYFFHYEEPKTRFHLHPALSGVARGTLDTACGVVQR